MCAQTQKPSGNRDGRVQGRCLSLAGIEKRLFRSVEYFFLRIIALYIKYILTIYAIPYCIVYRTGINNNDCTVTAYNCFQLFRYGLMFFYIRKNALCQ